MKKIIGLMSGTSADGVDAALVEVTGSGIDTRVSLVEFVTVGYPKSLREAVLNQSRRTDRSRGSTVSDQRRAWRTVCPGGRGGL